MHKLIVTRCHLSAVEPRDSRLNAHRDPDNRLLAKCSSRFRMSSLILRDWALASAGLLDSRIGGPPVYPYQPGAIWEALAITKEQATLPILLPRGNDLYRRSLYNGSGAPHRRSAANMFTMYRTGRHVGAINHDQYAAARPHNAQH